MLKGEGNGNPLQYSCLENPVGRGAWRASVHRVAQSQTGLKRLSMHACMHWRQKWQSTPVFLPGESQGQRSLVSCRLWGRTESITTEGTQQQQQQHTYLMGEPMGCTTILSLEVQFSCSIVSDSLRPHGLQPTRILRPWDFPGKST